MSLPTLPGYDDTASADDNLKTLFGYLSKRYQLEQGQPFDSMAPGWGNRSPINDVTPPVSAGTPSAPTNLKVVGVYRQAIISWDVDPNPYVMDWEIQRKTGAGAFTTVAMVHKTNSYTDQELADSTAYDYQVRALLGDGTASSYSSTVTGTTLANDTTVLSKITDGFKNLQASLLSSLWPLSSTLGGTGVDTSGSTGVATVASGVWSILARLTAALGGTGIDSSASTGVPKVNAGTWSVQALTNSQALWGSTGAVPVAGSLSSSDGTITVTAAAGAPDLKSPLRGPLILSTGGPGLLATGATNYFGAPVAPSATESDVEMELSYACTVRNMYAHINGPAPGAGTSYAFTVRKNGADTAITCTVSGTNIKANDTTHSAAFAKGDRIAIKSIPSGTPAGTFCTVMLETQGT